MSKIGEYIKLIPKVKLGKFVESQINQVRMNFNNLPPEDVAIIMDRRSICNACPYNSYNMINAGKYETERDDLHCFHCGCPIEDRTASLKSNCGIENYNAENPSNQMPLKWAAKVNTFNPKNFIVKKK